MYGNWGAKEVLARIRYRQPLEKATLFREAEGLFVLFDAPQSAIAEANLWRGI